MDRVAELFGSSPARERYFWVTLRGFWRPCRAARELRSSPPWDIPFLLSRICVEEKEKTYSDGRMAADKQTISLMRQDQQVYIQISVLWHKSLIGFAPSMGFYMRSHLGGAMHRTIPSQLPQLS